MVGQSRGEYYGALAYEIYGEERLMIHFSINVYGEESVRRFDEVNHIEVRLEDESGLTSQVLRIEAP